ncbi:MAG: DEAD/DEAH box helicase, partial [Verrucomicrobia bacterium]|nr:DEAD/DEAH box helicase [Verrucomicrobiota bacterium]
MDGIFGSLIPEVQHALQKEGYSTPTPVQGKTILPQIEGRDLFGSAQTGTGKTAAFTIPLLQELAAEKINPEGRHPRALILAPTRELAAQIGDSITAYGRFLQVSHTVIYGGVGQGPQEKAMNRGVDIVVATPGRAIDHIRRG